MSFNYLAPERFRVTWSNGRRFYVDREPACDIAGPTAEKELLPNCTSIAKAVGSDSFFKKVGSSRVPLDALRVADGVNANWDTLATMPADERRETMANYAPRDLARAGDRGTAVHALIEGLLQGQPALFLDGEADAYRDVAERVAADFAPLLSHMEIVAFNRGDHPYGGTFDGIHAETGLILDWKTRGPDAKHGCYEKEVAQLGLAVLCDYWFAASPDGTPTRRTFPPITELLVVSIRPDGYEVYPVDPIDAVVVAQRALEIHAAKSDAGKAARRAVGDPRPMPAVAAEPFVLKPLEPVVTENTTSLPRRIPSFTTPTPTPEVDEGPLVDAETATAQLTAGFQALGVDGPLMKTWNRWVKDGRFRFSDLPTERRYHLYRAGARLVSWSGGVDAEARSVIAAVLGTQPGNVASVGKALGALTTEQAKALADVCDAITNGAALVFDDNGVPTVAA